YDKWIATVPTDKTGGAFLPLWHLVEMVTADRDVHRDDRGRRSSEQNVFCGSLEKVVFDFPGATRVIATSPGDRLRISAASDPCRAVEVVQVGIDNRNVGTAAQLESAAGLVLGRPVDPQAIEDQVVGRRRVLDRDQRDHLLLVTRPRYFQSDQAVVIGAIQKDNWGRSVGLRIRQPREHVLRVCTLVGGTIRQRGHAGIAGREPLAFRRKSAVGSAGANDNPVLVIAALGRECE